uniref:Uncharacterized protein n=1 Tax=Hippocampus comes TaxID=109280 RepID=A0A3Q2Z7U9_HIPCM
METTASFCYYFKHPWSRITVAYLVVFFNFLIFAEDPVSHSQTEAYIAVVGNCFSFLFNKYPGAGWSVLKVGCWLLAILTGLVAGKFVFHQLLFGKSCALECDIHVDMVSQKKTTQKKFLFSSQNALCGTMHLINEVIRKLILMCVWVYQYLNVSYVTHLC